MTKFLITGLGGFQATHVAYTLLKQGHEIAGICSPRENSVKNLKLLAKHTTPEEHAKLQVVFGSIEDKNLVNRMVEECDMVLHTAAKIHVDESIDNPNEFFETNIKATYEILNAVTKHKKKMVHWSTCFDKKTEAWTTNGWKPYNQLTKNDKVLSLNPKTKKVEIKPITNIIIKKHKGDMIRFKTKRIDTLVTPEHRIYHEDDDGKIIVSPASELLLTENIKYPDNFSWDGITSDTIHISNIGYVNAKHLFYLTGIFIGDGYVCFQEKEVKNISGFSKKERMIKCRNRLGRFVKNIIKGPKKTSISMSYRNYIAIPKTDSCRKKVENILTELGIKWSNYKRTEDGMDLIYFTSKEWGEYFKKCGNGAHNKYIPKWMLQYNSDLLQSLFNGLLDSDGHKYQSFTTVSNTLVSDFTELCIKLGLKVNINKLHKISFIKDRKIEGDCYKINISKTPRKITKPEQKNIEKYNDIVWCVSVKDNKNLLVKRNNTVYFSGNCEVYGGNHTTEFIYEDHPLLPMSPYASSKAAGDCIAHSYHETYKTQVVVIRPGNIYGPLQKSEKHASVIPIFFRKGTHNESITIHGTGKQKRDFVYITDLVSAVTKIIDSFDKFNGKIINIGTGEQVTINYLAETITELTCSKGEVKHVGERPGQVTTFYLKSKVMPYDTKVTIKEGLTKYDTFLKTGIPFEEQ